MMITWSHVWSSQGQRLSVVLMIIHWKSGQLLLAKYAVFLINELSTKCKIRCNVSDDNNLDDFNQSISIMKLYIKCKPTKCLCTCGCTWKLWINTNISIDYFVLQCLKTLVGHTGGVWSSQMDGNIIISGSTDRTLKVWNAETGQCTHTLYGHTSTVRCMHLHRDQYVFATRCV